VKHLFFAIVFSLVCFSNLFAQEDEIPDSPQSGGTGIIRVEDTLKTYFKYWHLGADNLPHEQEVDTFLTFFHHYNPMYRNSFQQLSVNTGNFGSPVLKQTQGNFFFNHSYLYYNSLQPSIYNRATYFFFQTNEQYGFNNQNGLFYHTNKPYSSIFYHMNGSVSEEEQSLRFEHSQNVNKSLNIGINYNLMNSIGTYWNQKTSNNSLRLFSSFIGRVYMAHASFSFNKFKNSENGGVSTEADLSENANIVRMNLQEALSTNKNNNVLLVQRLNFGKKVLIEKDTVAIQRADSIRNAQKMLDSEEGITQPPPVINPADTIPQYDFILKHSITHRFEYVTHSRIYTDPEPTSGFYQNVFHADSSLTRDSVFYRSFLNTFEWQLPVNPERKILPLLGLRFLASNEIDYHHNLKHFILKQNDTLISNTYIGAHLFKDKGKFLHFDFSSKYYVLGYKLGDYSLKGEMKQFIKSKKDSSVVAVAGTIEQTTPDIFFQKYYSNHFKWNNNFDDQFTIKIDGAFTKPAWNLSVGGGLQLLHNHLYMGVDTLPHQTSNAIEGMYAFVNKDFRLGVFHFNNRVLYQQYSDNSVIHYPDLALLNTTYFEYTFFKNVLQVQLGFDITYTTEHFAPAYMPALGLYYVQNEIKTGNYPMIDVFLNAKLKGAFLFLKFEHLNTAITGEKYMPVVNYPSTEMMFRFGVFWRFFN